MENPAVLTVEEVVSQVWCATLGLEQLPAQANIFNLGADSMTAVAIAAQLTERLGVEVTLGDLVDLPVLEEFAAWLAGVVEEDE